MSELSKTVWIVGLAKLALHLFTSARGYGIFGDEFYYLACAAHPDFGYVDHPPLSIWILAGWTGLVGDSLASLRVFPALVGAASVIFAGVLARELGGRGPAQVLTAIVVALAPVNLVVHGYYSMNSVDVLVWMIAFVLISSALRTGSSGHWFALGALLGIGLLNKITVLWLGAGLLAGLLVTPHRRVFRTAGPWIAGALAALLFLPHILWQVENGWPTAEFIRVATTQKMLPVPPLELFTQQILVWNPLVFPLWLVGGVSLLRRNGDDAGRVLATIFVVTAAILIVNGTSRPNYLALAMPPLIAAGAIAAERATLQRRLRWPMPVATALIAVVGLASTPLTLPVLSVPDLIELKGAFEVGAPKMENREVDALDPHFADMLGWEEIVDTVADVYLSLPPEDRASAGILAVSYSEAGAIDRLGAGRGLPGAISPHNNYWQWGTGETDGSVMVIAGGPIELWEPYWDSIEEAAVWDCGSCLPGRNHSKVYVAREPLSSMDQIWRALRRYD
ncbi:MAG: glycosyltransferase family 39 protein [Myxococcota bacterium]